MTTQSQVKGNPRRWTTYGIPSPGSLKYCKNDQMCDTGAWSEQTLSGNGADWPAPGRSQQTFNL